MAFPSSATTTSDQQHPNSMPPDHFPSQFMMQDAFVAGLRASTNGKNFPGPSPLAAWQPNWNIISSMNATRMQQISSLASIDHSAFTSSFRNSPQDFPEVNVSGHTPSLSTATWNECPASRKDWPACQFPGAPFSQSTNGALNQLSSLSTVQSNLTNDQVVSEGTTEVILQRNGGSGTTGSIASLGPYLASNLAQCLQSGIHKKESLAPASAWTSCSMNALTGEQRSPGSGTLHESIANYPFDSGFAERAARFSSLTAGDYSCFGGSSSSNSPSLTLGETNPKKFLASSTNAYQGPRPQPGHPSPIRNMTAPKVSGKDSKHETSDDCIQSGGGGDHQMKTSLPGLTCEVPQLGQRLQQCRSTSGSDSEAILNTFPVESPSTNQKITAPLKKRRSQQEDEIEAGNITSCAATNGSDDSKMVDSPSKRQKGPLSPNKTEGLTAEDEKEKSACSEGTSTKAGRDQKTSCEATKQDFIHVRARRGQATDSHSLAERVRREKISERMRFLQDLVPGCSKITGKAMMLDEIINYVQSLQNQVEFLSMKLATLSPRIDFKVEGNMQYMGEVVPSMSSALDAGRPLSTDMATSSSGLSYNQSRPVMRDLNPSCMSGLSPEIAHDRITCSSPGSVSGLQPHHGYSQQAAAIWSSSGRFQNMFTRMPDLRYDEEALLSSGIATNRLMDMESCMKVEM